MNQVPLPTLWNVSFDSSFPLAQISDPEDAMVFDEKITVSDGLKNKVIGLPITSSGVHEMCFKHHGNGKSFSSRKADNILHLTFANLVIPTDLCNIFQASKLLQ